MARELSERFPAGPRNTREHRWQWLNGTQPLGELPRPLARPVRQASPANVLRFQPATLAQQAQAAQQQVAPVAARAWVDGIDIASDNDVPRWNDLLNAGYKFVLLKCNEWGVDVGRVKPVPRAAFNFWARWPQLKAGGLLRSAYDLVRPRGGTPVQQADTLVGAVKRLTPGDLAPMLDLEDRLEEPAAAPPHKLFSPFSNANNPGFWVRFAHTYLDHVEAALGRQPIIYTSRSWWEEFAGMSAEFTDYPLCVVLVDYAGTNPLSVTSPHHPRLPWRDWTFWQWHYEHSMDPMPALFTDVGVDLDRFNGSIWQLRGMADLGRTVPHNSRRGQHVAYVQPDGHIHLLTFTGAGAWRDDDLTFQSTQKGISDPGAVALGDPAAVTFVGREFIVYRSTNGQISCFSRSETAALPDWGMPQPLAVGAPARAVSDPSVIVSGNQLHVTYWRDDDHLVRAWWDGAWHLADMTQDSGSPGISGNPATYTFAGAVHSVSRAGKEGHLYDLWSDAGGGKRQDITHDSTPPRGIAATPAATYSPAVYYWAETSDTAWPRIVFRAVRGKIWEIARDTLQARNLSDEAGGAPTAAGSPAAFVVNGEAHVVYRGIDGHIYDITRSNGPWRYRDTGCSHAAAADPSVLVVPGGARQLDVGYVTFRGADGGVYRLILDARGWACESIKVSPARGDR
jgi:GH25 family lysozyme M1 (1,4-beta-N-acetylmuramidase)